MVISTCYPSAIRTMALIGKFTPILVIDLVRCHTVIGLMAHNLDVGTGIALALHLRIE